VTGWLLEDDAGDHAYSSTRRSKPRVPEERRTANDAALTPP
jgi:hypothetical protein